MHLHPSWGPRTGGTWPSPNGRCWACLRFQSCADKLAGEANTVTLASSSLCPDLPSGTSPLNGYQANFLFPFCVLKCDRWLSPDRSCFKWDRLSPGPSCFPKKLLQMCVSRPPGLSRAQDPQDHPPPQLPLRPGAVSMGDVGRHQAVSGEAGKPSAGLATSAPEGFLRRPLPSLMSLRW